MDEKKTNPTNAPDNKKPAPPPIDGTKKPTPPPIDGAKKTTSAPPAVSTKQTVKAENRKIALILIPVILCIIAGAVTGAVLLSKGGKFGKDKGPTAPTLPPVVYATYENGIAITDDSGMVVTLVPETTEVPVTELVTAVVTEKTEEVVTVQVEVPVTEKVIVAVTDINGNNVTDASGENVTEITFVPVTDENGEQKTTLQGEAVTDENGKEKTTVSYDVVTDENGEEKTTLQGEAVTDNKGNTLTTVIYENVDVTVNVPVTNNKGEEVTNSKGETVTEQVVIQQDPNAQKPGGSVVLGTTGVPITDGMGNTALDQNSEPYTQMQEITSNPSTVEPAAIQWKCSLGGTEADYFSSIDSDSDGNFIAANITNSKNGDFKGFESLGYKTPYTVLVKYNKKGNEVWRKAIGSKSGLLVLNDVIVNKDGSFYAVGYGKNVGGVNVSKDPTKGYYDATVYKFDKDGNELWHKVFGTSTVDLFNAGTLSSDGGIIAVGTVGTNDGDAAGFNKPALESAACIVKYDSNGKLVWKNVVGGNTDTFNDVCVEKDGGIYCVGNFASGNLFPCLGKTDGGVVKFTSKGKFDSATPIAGTGNDLFSGITACKTGGVVIVGRSNSNDLSHPDSLFIDNMGSRGGYDAYIIKLDETLGISFAKPFRGQYDDNLVDIVEKEDGSFVAVGCSNSSTRDFKGITTRGGDDIVIASFDLYGNLTWARSFGGTADESAYAVCISPKGGYAVAGRTLSKNIDMAGIAQYVNGKSVGVIVNFPE